jgi:MFS family permease
MLVMMLRFGRRPIMGVSFIIITIAGFMCALAPQKEFGFKISYVLFALGRFLLACATRGIGLTGFVIGR